MAPGSPSDWPGRFDRPGRLGPEFYDRPVLQVAPDLLGCLITHNSVTVRLTEVEAYDGERDPGSHAFRGRTPRTEVMFGPPGGLYVYFTYGMHFCANVVCGPSGRASAVLLRAGEVVAGAPEALARRTRPGGRPPNPRDLARGPARMTVALGIGREHNGVDTTAQAAPVWLSGAVEPGEPGESRVRQGPRVGVSGPGGDPAVYPWRFWLADEPTVSVYRPAVARARSVPARADE